MSVYFEKARELGEMILKSEESKNLADARAVFEADQGAVTKLNDYNDYQAGVQMAMETGKLSKEEFQSTSKKMTEMATELKADAVIGGLVKAENDFNTFVNGIMNILKSTITGETECSGSCGGCGSKGNGCGC